MSYENCARFFFFFFFFSGQFDSQEKLYRCPGIVYITGTLNSDGKIGISGPYKLSRPLRGLMLHWVKLTKILFTFLLVI